MTKRTRRKRSKRKPKRTLRGTLRGGTFLPSFLADIGRSAVYQMESNFNGAMGRYLGPDPNVMRQPIENEIKKYI